MEGAVIWYNSAVDGRHGGEVGCETRDVRVQWSITSGVAAYSLECFEKLLVLRFPLFLRQARWKRGIVRGIRELVVRLNGSSLPLEDGVFAGVPYQ